MRNLEARLLGALQAAGVPVVDLQLPDRARRETWTVIPSSLQVAAQPTIDAFDQADPAHEQADLDATVRADIDRRFMAAYTWVLLKRQFPSDTDAQTKTKLAAIRDAVITAYLAQPWTS